MINVIIPINGLGSRFAQENYTLPKPLINVLGKRMIFWVIDSLKLSSEDTLIIPYSNQLDYYNFRDIVTDHYPGLNIQFIQIDRPTKGAAETILLGIQNMTNYKNKDVPVLVIDCDTFYETDVVSRCKTHPSNVIHYFIDRGMNPIFSYLDLAKHDVVTNIEEKVRISNYASTGAYAFESTKLLEDYCNKLMDHNELMTNGEYYVSAIYKLMIKDGLSVYGRQVDKFHCVGTPLQLKVFCETYKQEPKRFCFDLDSTLVTKPRVPNDYTTVEPIEKNINTLRFLKSMGHTIIINTARRMRTHNGNVGAIVADVGKITLDTLEKFDVPYDELYFGKPWADFYIDDLGVDCNHDIEKAIGYYNTITKPRDFNFLDMDIDTVTKTGKVDGEIYFYNAIKEYPQLEYLFPKLIESTDDSLKIERIDGVTFSYLLQNNSLTIPMFVKLLIALREIHTTEHPHKDAKVDSMLVWQFENRLNNFDYSKYGDPRIVDRVLDFVNEYVSSRRINATIVHGDPVFSNVLYDKRENIKLIDMRGKLSNTKTLMGDPLYDLAKVYQSLMGYDFILNDRRIVKNKQLIDVFENHVLDCGFSMNDVRMMTGALYISLIPLHDNDKCFKYYELGSQLLEI